MQPFLQEKSNTIDALKNMAASLSKELDAMLSYYGEKPDTPESPKPEDFLGLILSFSSSLQVGQGKVYLSFFLSHHCWQKCGIEVHEAESKTNAAVPQISLPTQEPEIKAELVSASRTLPFISYSLFGRPSNRMSRPAET